MQDNWYSKRAEEIQGNADNHDSKHFYDALKALYGPQTSGSSSLLSADGTQLLSEKKQTLERWAECFESVLNHPSTIKDEAITHLTQVETNQEMDNLPTEGY